MTDFFSPKPLPFEVLPPISKDQILETPDMGPWERFSTRTNNMWRTYLGISPLVNQITATNERKKIVEEITGKAYDEAIAPYMPAHKSHMHWQNEDEALTRLREKLPDDQRSRIFVGSELKARERELAVSSETYANIALEQSGGIHEGTLNLVGQIPVFMADPINLLAMVMGGPASTAAALAMSGASLGGRIAAGAGVEAGINVLAELGSQPFVQQYRQELGLPAGWQEALMDVGFAAVVGGAFGGAGTAGRYAYRKARGSVSEDGIEIPTPISRALRSTLGADLDIGSMTGRQVVEAAKLLSNPVLDADGSILPAFLRFSGEQRAALDIIDRALFLRETTPPRADGKPAGHEEVVDHARTVEAAEKAVLTNEVIDVSRMADGDPIRMAARNAAEAVKADTARQRDPIQSLTRTLLPEGRTPRDLKKVLQIASKTDDPAEFARQLGPGGATKALTSYINSLLKANAPNSQLPRAGKPRLTAVAQLFERRSPKMKVNILSEAEFRTRLGALKQRAVPGTESLDVAAIDAFFVPNQGIFVHVKTPVTSLVHEIEHYTDVMAGRVSKDATENVFATLDHERFEADFLHRELRQAMEMAAPAKDKTEPRSVEEDLGDLFARKQEEAEAQQRGEVTAEVAREPEPTPKTPDATAEQRLREHDAFYDFLSDKKGKLPSTQALVKGTGIAAERIGDFIDAALDAGYLRETSHGVVLAPNRTKPSPEFLVSLPETLAPDSVAIRTSAVPEIEAAAPSKADKVFALPRTAGEFAALLEGAVLNDAQFAKVLSRLEKTHKLGKDVDGRSHANSLALKRAVLRLIDEPALRALGEKATASQIIEAIKDRRARVLAFESGEGRPRDPVAPAQESGDAAVSAADAVPAPEAARDLPAVVAGRGGAGPSATRARVSSIKDTTALDTAIQQLVLGAPNDPALLLEYATLAVNIAKVLYPRFALEFGRAIASHPRLRAAVVQRYGADILDKVTAGTLKDADLRARSAAEASGRTQTEFSRAAEILGLDRAALYQGGGFDDPVNRPVVDAYMFAITGEPSTPISGLTLGTMHKMRATLVEAAYGDPVLTQAALDGPDNPILSQILRALEDSAGHVARMRYRTKTAAGADGRLAALDIAAELARVYHVSKAMLDKGIPFSRINEPPTLLRDVFGNTPVHYALMRLFHGVYLNGEDGRQAIAAFISEYVEIVSSIGVGESVNTRPSSALEIISAATLGRSQSSRVPRSTMSPDGTIELRSSGTASFNDHVLNLGIHTEAGAEIGGMTLQRHRNGRYEITMIRVAEEHRRMGVASKTYDAVEALIGDKLRPSGTLYPMGYLFWQRRDPQSVKHHVYSPADEVYLSPKALIDLHDNANSSQDRAHYKYLLDQVPRQTIEDRALMDSMFSLGPEDPGAVPPGYSYGSDIAPTLEQYRPGADGPMHPREPWQSDALRIDLEQAVLADLEAYSAWAASGFDPTNGAMAGQYAAHKRSSAAGFFVMASGGNPLGHNLPLALSDATLQRLAAYILGPDQARQSPMFGWDYAALSKAIKDIADRYSIPDTTPIRSEDEAEAVRYGIMSAIAGGDPVAMSAGDQLARSMAELEGRGIVSSETSPAIAASLAIADAQTAPLQLGKRRIGGQTLEGIIQAYAEGALTHKDLLALAKSEFGFKEARLSPKSIDDSQGLSLLIQASAIADALGIRNEQVGDIGLLNVVYDPPSTKTRLAFYSPARKEIRMAHTGRFSFPHEWMHALQYMTSSRGKESADTSGVMDLFLALSARYLDPDDIARAFYLAVHGDVADKKVFAKYLQSGGLGDKLSRAERGSFRDGIRENKEFFAYWNANVERAARALSLYINTRLGQSQDAIMQDLSRFGLEAEAKANKTISPADAREMANLQAAIDGLALSLTTQRDGRLAHRQMTELEFLQDLIDAGRDGIKSLYSFGSEKALGADLPALARAQEMERAGKGNEEIWKETGWFKKKDGWWRFEIDDSELALRPEWVRRIGPKKPRRTFDGRLGDLINAEKLFANYPQLADMRVLLLDTDEKKISRHYDRKERKIVLSNRDTPDEMVETLIHELQHAVQHIEKLSMGGNLETLAARAEIAMSDLINNIKTLRPGSNIRHQLVSMLRRLERAHGNGLRMFPVRPDMDMASYERFIGEVEARNAAFRRSMTEAQRRQSYPLSTEDFSEFEQFDPAVAHVVTFEHERLARAAVEDRRLEIEQSGARGYVIQFYNPGDRTSTSGPAPRAGLTAHTMIALTPEGIGQAISNFGTDLIAATARDWADHFARQEAAIGSTRDLLSPGLAEIAAVIDSIGEQHPALRPRQRLAPKVLDPDGLIDEYTGPVPSAEDMERAYAAFEAILPNLVGRTSRDGVTVTAETLRNYMEHSEKQTGGRHRMVGWLRIAYPEMLDALNPKERALLDEVNRLIKTAEADDLRSRLQLQANLAETIRANTPRPEEQRPQYRLTATGQSLRPEMEAALEVARRMVPDAIQVRAERPQTILGRPIFGRYEEGLQTIFIAMDLANPERTARHEVIHALKSLGLIEDKEWAALVKVAEERWMAEYNIERDYGRSYAGNRQLMVEEAIAHAFSDWRKGDLKDEGVHHNLFARVWRYIMAIIDELRGRGIDTENVDAIFERVDSGAVAKRFDARERERDIRVNRAVYSKAEEDKSIAAQMRRQIDHLGFYSAALEAARALKQEKGLVKDMVAAVANTPGVSPKEMEALALDKALPGRNDPTITKEELVKLIDERRTKTDEHVYTDVGKDAAVLRNPFLSRIYSMAARFKETYEDGKYITTLSMTAEDGAAYTFIVDQRIWERFETFGLSDPLRDRGERRALPVSITKDGEPQGHMVLVATIDYSLGTRPADLALTVAAMKYIDEGEEIIDLGDDWQWDLIDDTVLDAFYRMFPNVIRGRALVAQYPGLPTRTMAPPGRPRAFAMMYEHYALPGTKETYYASVLHRGQDQGDNSTHHFDSTRNQIGHTMAGVVKTDDKPALVLMQIQSDPGQAITKHKKRFGDTDAEGRVDVEALVDEGRDAERQLDSMVEYIHGSHVDRLFYRVTAGQDHNILTIEQIARYLEEEFIINGVDDQLGVHLAFLRRIYAHYYNVPTFDLETKHFDPVVDVDNLVHAFDVPNIRDVPMQEYLQDILFIFALDRTLESLQSRVIDLAIQVNDLGGVDVPSRPFTHPTIATTDAWLDIVLKRALVQAARADLDYVVTPTGETVLSYNPGGEDGMIEFYNKIVPKNMAALIAKLDKSAPKRQFVQTVESLDGGEAVGQGFYRFELTGLAKQRILQEGLPLYHLGPEPPARPEPKPYDFQARPRAIAEGPPGLEVTLISDFYRDYIEHHGAALTWPEFKAKIVEMAEKGEIELIRPAYVAESRIDDYVASSVLFAGLDYQAVRLVGRDGEPRVKERAISGYGDQGLWDSVVVDSPTTDAAERNLLNQELRRLRDSIEEFEDREFFVGRDEAGQELMMTPSSLLDSIERELDVLDVLMACKKDTGDGSA